MTQLPLILALFLATGSLTTTLAYETVALSLGSASIAANELRKDALSLRRRGERVTADRISLLKWAGSYDKFLGPATASAIGILAYAWSSRITYFGAPIVSVKLLTILTDIGLVLIYWPYFWRIYVQSVSNPRTNEANSILVVGLLGANIMGFVTVALSSQADLVWSRITLRILGPWS